MTTDYRIRRSCNLPLFHQGRLDEWRNSWREV